MPNLHNSARWASIAAMAILGAATALCLDASNVAAGPVPPGVYAQVGVNAGPGDCPTCTITITHLTPHMIGIVANNNWLGYAVYTSGDKYVGSWEWKRGQGGSYEGQVFSAEFTYDDKKLLVMTAKSAKGTVEAFYRLK